MSALPVPSRNPGSSPISRIKTHPSLAFVLALGLVQCAGFFQGAGEALVSDADEVKLGAQFHQTLLTNDTARREFPLYVPKNQAEADLQAYVTDLCQRALAAVPAKDRPKYDFTFTFIDKDVENAFAVPGGYVYIYTGILKKFQDESELAGVIGHEITHVTHHHFRESLAKNAALGLSLQLLLGTTNAGQVGQMAAGTFFQLAGLKFSRSAERDADEGGTRMLAAMGLNPLGIAKYFSRSKGQGVPEWLATHPGPRNRVKAIREYVNAHPELNQLAADSVRTNHREAFKAKISPLSAG
jgi:beta-barrel assembly-enhancing protease